MVVTINTISTSRPTMLRYENQNAMVYNTNKSSNLLYLLAKIIYFTIHILHIVNQFEKENRNSTNTSVTLQ